MGAGSSREKRIGTPGHLDWGGLVTLDYNADHNPDVVHDLNVHPLPLPRILLSNWSLTVCDCCVAIVHLQKLPHSCKQHQGPGTPPKSQVRQFPLFRRAARRASLC